MCSGPHKNEYILPSTSVGFIWVNPINFLKCNCIEHVRHFLSLFPTQFCIVIVFSIVNNIEMIHCAQEGAHTLCADPVLIYETDLSIYKFLVM